MVKIMDVQCYFQHDDKIQELLTLHEHLDSSLVFLWGPCCSSF